MYFPCIHTHEYILQDGKLLEINWHTNIKHYCLTWNVQNYEVKACITKKKNKLPILVETTNVNKERLYLHDHCYILHLIWGTLDATITTLTIRLWNECTQSRPRYVYSYGTSLWLGSGRCTIQDRVESPLKWRGSTYTPLVYVPSSNGHHTVTVNKLWEYDICKLLESIFMCKTMFYVWIVDFQRIP